MLQLSFVLSVTTTLFVLTAGQDMDPTVVNLENVPVAVLQELLSLTDDGIVNGELERGSRKIHRLRGSDVAYFEFKFNGQYVILANPGRRHVDDILVSRGSLPSPTESVTLTASKSGVSCSRYVLLAPEGPLGCVGSDGELIAGSEQWENDLEEAGVLRKLQGPTGKVDWRRAYRLSERRFRGLWSAYERSVSRSLKVQQFVLQRRDQPSKSNVRPLFYIEDALKPGQTIKIVKTEHFSRLTMTATSGTPKSKDRSLDVEYIRSIRNDFCKVLNGISCNPNNTEVVAEVEEQSVNGLTYIAITLNGRSSDLQTLFRRRGIGIVFKAYYTRPNQSLTLRYGLDVASVSREKRRVRARTANVAVPDERRLFPDYGQFRTKAGCAVGSGPVAWAMVLGYLDRVGHFLPSSNYSTDLYPKKVAPRLSSRLDEDLISWITSIGEHLGTKCRSNRGITLVSQMSNVESIYTDIQADGEFKEHLSNETSAGEVAIDYIKNGSPAVVRITSPVRVFARHYAVATKAQRRYYAVRKCYFWGLCIRWQRRSAWYLYIHRGRAGRWNGWIRASDVDYAATLTK